MSGRHIDCTPHDLSAYGFDSTAAKYIYSLLKKGSNVRE